MQFQQKSVGLLIHQSMNSNPPYQGNEVVFNLLQMCS